VPSSSVVNSLLRSFINLPYRVLFLGGLPALFRPILTIWLLHWLRSERNRLRPGEVFRFKGYNIEVVYERPLKRTLVSESRALEQRYGDETHGE
jgi:hypothetical protein